MTPHRPVVSVIVSSADPGHSESLERTIRSVAAQSFPSIELLICRSESASGLAWQCADDRFVPVFVEAPSEGAGAWNLGFERASGSYICCLLAGDQLSPTFLEKCLFHVEVTGAHAVCAFEYPSGPLPQVLVVRKQVLRHMGGYDENLPLGQQRLDVVARLLAGNFSLNTVPETLARHEHAVNAPVSQVAPIPEGADHAGFSYAPLVTGWQQPRPTVLVSMPFLSVGGAEAAVSQVCRQLKSFGFRVLVYTTAPCSPSQGDSTAWFEDSAAGIYHLPRFLPAGYWQAFIAYLVQQHGVTILWQVGSSYTYELLPFLRELFPQLAIVDLLFNEKTHVPKYREFNYLIDHVITEHDGMKRCLLDQGAQEDSVSVIRNGVDLETFSPRPKLDWRTLQPITASDSRFVVAFLGRLSREKGPDIFLQIASRLAPHKKFEFLILGSGAMERELRGQAASLGLNGRVNFLRFVSTREYLCCCDLVVICSRLDGRPNSMMESLAAGVPVVAGRVGAIPDLMPPNLGDLLCDPEDIDGFAEAIQNLADDHARYRQAGLESRRHAEANFSAAQSGAAYAELFRKLSERRQHLDRKTSTAAITASLGYPQARELPAPPPRLIRLLRNCSPANWRPHLRNAWLLWGLRRGGESEKLLAQFDASYYKRQFPKQHRLRSPLLHYIFFGFREGRNPSANFNTRFYLMTNPDVWRSGMNPLLHYVMWGMAEGRVSTPHYQIDVPPPSDTAAVTGPPTKGSISEDEAQQSNDPVFAGKASGAK